MKVPCCRMQEHATPSTALQVLNQGAKVQSCRPRRRRQFGTSASQSPMLILVGLGFTRVFAWCFVWFQYDETFRSVRHFLWMQCVKKILCQVFVICRLFDFLSNCKKNCWQPESRSERFLLSHGCKLARVASRAELGFGSLS